jgi:uncharacterized protein YbjT (DUF2867 family)
MKVIILGATGLIGSGVLDECLDDDRVEKVTAILRTKADRNHPKLKQIIHKDFLDYSKIEEQLTGLDACFWCLGDSEGNTEEEYRKIVKNFALVAAKSLLKVNPNITFIFISGAGTKIDSSMIWARVKAETEIELGKLDFKNQYNMRPALIRSENGVKPRQLSYRILVPIVSLFLRLWGSKYIIGNRQIGKAMINLTESGSEEITWENKEMVTLAKRV